jgi:hypothetical protein
MLVENNGGGTINFLGTNTFNTGAADAVTLTNNDNGGNTTITIGGLNITTTSGDGFTATGGGTLSVTGLTNQINTDDGIGLNLNGMTIGAVDFQRVTVDGGTGPTNAIILDTLTGGQVAIGTAAGAQNSGGMLTSTGDAIVVTDVANVDLRHIQIVDAGDEGLAITHSSSAAAMDVTIDDLNLDLAAGNGIEVLGDNDANDFRLRLTNSDLEENVTMSVTGAGAFLLLVEDTAINVTGATDAFALEFSDEAVNGDVTIRNNDGVNIFTADTGRALFIDSAGTTASKNIDLLLEDSTFRTNNGLVAAAEVLSGGDATFFTTIQGNTFDAAGGNDLDVRADGATARMRLNLGGDPVTSPTDMNNAVGTGTFVVRELNGADFDIFELDDTVVTDIRNNAAVNADPAAGVFQDLPAPPPLPTLP